jgi:hypothetical protein
VTALFGSLSQTDLVLLWAILFLLLAIAGECGFRLERWRTARRTAPEPERSGISTVTASMFALLAFTLGLTISFAQSRFEARRDLVVQEANSIGTAWLRARLVGDQEGPAIAALIEDYAKVRRDYTAGDREDEIPERLARTGALQTQMWHLATELARRTPTPISASLIAALNDMFDASLAQVSRLPRGFRRVSNGRYWAAPCLRSEPWAISSGRPVAGRSCCRCCRC